MTLYGRGRALLEALLVDAGSADNGALAEALRMDPEDLRQSAADLCAQLAAMERRRTDMDLTINFGVQAGNKRIFVVK